MNKTEEELWELIQEKEAEVKALRQQHFELTRKDEAQELRDNYLGKYYLHKQFNDRWESYIFVNKLDEKANRLNCTLFTIMYEDKTDELYGVSCEDHYDFTCHYLSKYDDNPSINECVEITREQFLTAHETFLIRFLQSFKV